jgi:hypothetical protein
MSDDLKWRGVWSNSWRARAWRWCAQKLFLLITALTPAAVAVGLRVIGVRSPAFTIPGAWLSPTNILLGLCAVVLIALLVEVRSMRKTLGGMAADLADCVTNTGREIRVPPYDPLSALRIVRPLSDSERMVAEIAARVGSEPAPIESAPELHGARRNADHAAAGGAGVLRVGLVEVDPTRSPDIRVRSEADAGNPEARHCAALGPDHERDRDVPGVGSASRGRGGAVEAEADPQGADRHGGGPRPVGGTA